MEETTAGLVFLGEEFFGEIGGTAWQSDEGEKAGVIQCAAQARRDEASDSVPLWAAHWPAFVTWMFQT